MPVISLQDIVQDFAGPTTLRSRTRTWLRAVDGVSFEIGEGEAFGLVGESGSGKTTIGRVIVRLQEPTAGTVLFRGRAVRALKGGDLRTYRRDVQMIFQNPLAALNPRRKVGDQIGDPLEIHDIAKGRALLDRVAGLAGAVGLAHDLVDRYPHELSSGQRQRVGIARAMASAPSLVVADEPVSALDVSVQAQVLNLLSDLRAEQKMALLFISHDIRAVRYLCDRVAVLYLGRVMELADRDTLVSTPAHPYSQALMASIPSHTPGAKRDVIIAGDIAQERPNPAGCVFAPRCTLRSRLGNPDACTSQRPALQAVAPGHVVACHFAEEAMAEASSVGPMPLPVSSPANPNEVAAR